MKSSRRITIKVGSNVLSRPDGNLDVTRMSALVDQIAWLRSKGVEIILVSSGAVASGRSMLEPDRKLSNIAQRQLFSAIGQARLINRYFELFREHGIVVGQVLTMKSSFIDTKNYRNQRDCMVTMLENGVIPIVNENDTVSLDELMFTDNDELSGLISVMMDCGSLVILSNVDGIFNGAPGQEGAELIREVEAGADITSYIKDTKSRFGRGGMKTKSFMAKEVASQGIEVIIANGRRENILVGLYENPEEAFFTRFAPSDFVYYDHGEAFARKILEREDIL